MILSASRRTDIPAWYGAWFLNRLREGFALVPNPYAENLHMLRKIPLSPDVVDCIVSFGDMIPLSSMRHIL